MEKSEEKVKITVQNVLQHLKDGMTRGDINAKYGLTRSEGIALFQHPKLKGRKTYKAPSFVLIDEEEGTDTEIDAELLNVEVVEETVEVQEEDCRPNVEDAVEEINKEEKDNTATDVAEEVQEGTKDSW